jgi:hypothetical protein
VSIDINNEGFMDLVVKESGMDKDAVSRVVMALNKVEKNAIDSFMKNYAKLVASGPPAGGT